MRIYLVRHGEAVPAYVDPDRPLTPGGRTEIEQLAQWTKSAGHAPSEIRHSGILRAEQTAEILAAHLAPARGVRAQRGLEPDDDPDAWIDVLPHEPDGLMIVTHMPFVGALSSALLARTGYAAPHFATGTIACFERDGPAWRLVFSR